MRTLFAWALCLVGVLVLSLVPSAAPPGGELVEIWLHLGTFFFLTVMPLITVTTRRAATLCIAAVIALAFLSEGAQALVPGRAASFEDLAANLAGISLGLAGYFGIRWLRTARRKLSH